MELESILLPGIEAKRPIVIAGPCSAETEEQGDLRHGVPLHRAVHCGGHRDLPDAGHRSQIQGDVRGTEPGASRHFRIRVRHQ